MTEEIKNPGSQAPAETPAVAEQKPAEQSKTIEGMTPEVLKGLYAKSPELFAGIVPPVAPVVEKKAEAVPSGEAAKPPESVAQPEDIAVKLPEGVSVDEAVLSEFKAIAKANGLSSKQAQALVDYQLGLSNKAVEAQKAAVAQYEAGAIKALKTDAEFGKDFESNLEIAKQGLVKFASPELQKQLAESGFGKHPEIVRHFWRLGKADSEGSTVFPSSRPSKEAESEEAQYKSRYNHPTSQTMFGDGETSTP